VDVGGYALFITCSGAGEPLVILEAGAGYGVGEWWGELPAQVAQFTQVCMYDRAGIGQSDPPTGEWRTAQDLADDLHRLLENAGAEGPFVLVGHSLGGAIVRLYAATYPGEVAGLVLLDSMNEAYNKAEKDFLTPQEYARYADLMADSIEFSISGTLEELHAMRAASDTPLGDLPLVVIVRGTQPPSDLVSQETLQERLELWQALQADLATLSTSGTFIIAEESGHFIHLDQLDLVVETIQKMVEELR
jgi:pimeloyl-ACP methyl ester carboxylesterase